MRPVRSTVLRSYPITVVRSTTKACDIDKSNKAGDHATPYSYIVQVPPYSLDGKSVFCVFELGLDTRVFLCICDAHTTHTQQWGQEPTTPHAKVRALHLGNSATAKTMARGFMRDSVGYHPYFAPQVSQLLRHA